METKLKTLKDMEFGNPKALDEPVVKLKDLKAEAVKWVKEIKSSSGGEKWVDDPYCCLPCLVNWIKHFFNLNEEDLKDDN